MHYQQVFDDQPQPREGFRLQRLEVYNWGTFHNHVWIIAPQGSTSLLTGANGSGKSTLVDALLTLLVPARPRNYNQASGSLKKERDERTYVRGAYGRIKDNESHHGVVQYLRDKSSYSVLLACFGNEQLKQTVTLAQVFYFGKDDELKKLHIVAPRELSILEHFQLTQADEIKRAMRSLGAEVYDEFAKYSRDFLKRCGLRSAKALDLFNQTVAIKEIGGLNTFVRQHMLEKSDAQGRIDLLREHYKNLTSAHDAIAKAEAQLDRLRPLLAEAEQHAQLQARIVEAERCATHVPSFFARRKYDLLAQAIAHARGECERYSAQRAAVAAQLEAKRQQDRDLYAAITNDQIGQRLASLAQELERVGERMAERRKRAERYDRVAAQLGFATLADEKKFHATMRLSEQTLPNIDAELAKLQAARDQRKQEEGRLVAECQHLRAEVVSLQQRKSRIPAEDVRLRAELASALELPEEVMPFVGELLKVRDDQKAWEGAIERLLRGYGRQILVPEEHYRRVAGYVDGANLRGRLVYHRVGERRVPPHTSGLDTAALIFKLEIKPGSALHDWLKGDLIDHWDYICCDELSQFQRERRALSLQGQVKSGGSRHEKDDRFALNDSKRYVLGWDNREKIAALKQELQTLERTLQEVRKAIQANEQRSAQWKQRQQHLRDLLAFTSYAELNWRADEQQMLTLKTQQRELEASADHLQQLQQQRTLLLAQIEAEKQQLDQLNQVLGTLESDLKRFVQQQASVAAQFEDATTAPESIVARIEADLKGKIVRLETIDQLQGESERFYHNSSKALSGNLNKLESNVVAQIVNFKRDYPADTLDLDNSIAAVAECRRMLARIEHDDLPAHKERFKQWLDGKVLDSIIGFQSALDTQTETIRESVATLNRSLHMIDYTPATYIRLRADPTHDLEVQAFRRQLRACIPDVGQRSTDAHEASFQRIRALIERFETEERWTNKVADVRNWLDFAAEERYREDDKEKSFYSDSSGKSGGQKAKLAYTILASAIAYQYGLDQEEQRARTFRFVVVDEAFSKSDEENARYAMNLFKQLNLQLLVVTPLDKTHVVEPYIEACHFVSNTADENDSRVVNLTIHEYHAQKVAFGQLAQREA
ncbi:MAG: hypothetical protein EI684_22295 [Candidatus Viridilinea halotolerans]|uniref:AAA family ATPase n=1 Tax=Candidatus Viridilinea halotolerans TaxID=2491704 RepID=A0A426TQX2_9CHLR|nr:MAG: hypothetical protein EI684_22295 [Candidatus Viridilinea halotolerans]